MSKQKHVDVNNLELSALELRRVISMQEAARLRGCSVDTLKRQSRAGIGPRLIQISPRRVGCRLGDVLAD